MALIKPRTNTLFKRYVEGLITDLSKRSSVTAYMPVKQERCPNCIYDPVRKGSTGTYNGTGDEAFTGSMCPVCRNTGTVDVETQKIIKCIVRWGNTKTGTVPMAPGALPDGHAKLKTFVVDYDTLRDAAYFMVDGIRCSRVNAPLKRGLQSHVVAEMVVRQDE
jgi:hypothetical protein